MHGWYFLQFTCTLTMTVTIHISSMRINTNNSHSENEGVVVQSQECFKWHTVVMHSSWKNRSNTVTISGNSVNINIDCLESNDRLEFN